MEREISLVFPSSPFLIDQDVFPPLGILYIASALKSKGIKSYCYDLGIGHKPEQAETEIVGISLCTAQKEEGFRLIQFYKNRGQYVVVGGPHATHESSECYRAGADLVVNGYDLKPLFGLFGVLLNSSEFLFFNDFPIPDRSLLPINDYKYQIDGRPATPIMTTRSCYSNCSFCGRIPGNMEMLTSKRVIEEIDQINRDFGFTGFMIFDDVFTASKKRLEQISNYYEDKEYKFRCFSRTDLLTKAVCLNLKKMGVVEVGLGVESGSTGILARNMKGTTPDMNREAVELLRYYGIRAKTFLIVGLPGETHETVRETIKWIEDVKPDDLDVSIFKPMPGSQVYNNPEKFDIIFDKNDSFWYKGTPGKYNTTVRTKELSSEDIINYRNLIEEKYKKWN